MGIATFFFFRSSLKIFHLHQLGYMDVTRSLAWGEKNFKISILLGVTRTNGYIVSLCLGECECDSGSCLTSYLTSCFFVKFCSLQWFLCVQMASVLLHNFRLQNNGK